MKAYYKKNDQTIKMNSNIFKRERRKKEKGKIDYNLPRKNFIRDELIKIMNHYSIKTILTLESPEFLFCKKAFNTKIFVFEENTKIYNQMLKQKPKNVQLFFGDVTEFSNIPFDVDFIYLDFCSMIEYSLENVYLLREKIKNTKLFALTICLRGVSPERGDYEFDLLNKIQTLTGVNWKVLYGESYRETLNKGLYSSPMLTILLENPDRRDER
jgi:hypothetical protein